MGMELKNLDVLLFQFLKSSLFQSIHVLCEIDDVRRQLDRGWVYAFGKTKIIEALKAHGDRQELFHSMNVIPPPDLRYYIQRVHDILEKSADAKQFIFARIYLHTARDSHIGLVVIDLFLDKVLTNEGQESPDGRLLNQLN